jgi:tripartite-type tricarboxylate transporter receptor subunit TctC
VIEGKTMKRTNTRRSVLVAALALAMTLAADAAGAQTYPTRPVTVILPFAGGSASDVVTRILLDRVSKSMGQAFVIDNRPGAGGNIGTGAAAKADPDGYTLLASGIGPLASNRALYRNLGYDPEKDFDPISLFAVFPNIIVASTKLPVKSVAELIAYAKERPNQLNYGSVGIGSSQHLGGVLFEQLAGVELTHVPYRNIAQYTPDMIAGAVPLGFQWFPNVAAALRSGGARALAVPSKQRLSILPDAPTTAEAGIKDYDATGWFALLAPSGTPKEIVMKLHQEVAAAAVDPAVHAKFSEQGAEAVATKPEELAKTIASDTAKWRAVVAKAGIAVIQ